MKMTTTFDKFLEEIEDFIDEKYHEHHDTISERKAKNDIQALSEINNKNQILRLSPEDAIRLALLIKQTEANKQNKKRKEDF